MKPLAIIPARAGSKRIAGKNRQVIGGRTLTHHALDQAYEAFGGRVVLSSDDELSPPSASPFWSLIRPPHLALDDTPMMDVVRHVVAHALEYFPSFDAVVLLQPTSPLRTVADIVATLDLLSVGNDAAISVVETLEPEVFTIGHAGRLRRVEVEPDTYRRRMVIPNGAVFAIKLAVLDAGYDWWTAPVVAGYEMPAERSIDIDTPADLERARELWNRQQSSIA